MSISSVVGHFRTITRHRHRVIANCARAGILWQGLRHDLSKYSPTEFIPGVRYYTGTRSPNEGERAEKGYSLAWLHHKGRNRHHFEYWVDYIPGKGQCPVKMPLRFVAEMFCDRVAASMIYCGKDYTPSHPLEYFLRGKPRRVIHPETGELLESLLRQLAEEGEESVYARIRALIKSGKEY